MDKHRTPLTTTDESPSDSNELASGGENEKVALPATEILYQRALKRSAEIKAGKDRKVDARHQEEEE